MDYAVGYECITWKWLSSCILSMTHALRAQNVALILISDLFEPVMHQVLYLQIYVLRLVADAESWLQQRHFVFGP